MCEQTKRCGKCERMLLAASFHKRAASIDGLSACCKECQAAYDRTRLYKPDRVERRMLYKQTAIGQMLTQAGQKRWQDRNSVKRQAHVIVGNFIRDGRLLRSPCEVCGDPKSQAHHDDYTKPLEVRWLCHIHHIELHRVERERLRAAKAA